jgi:hypothetical protein
MRTPTHRSQSLSKPLVREALHRPTSHDWRTAERAQAIRLLCARARTLAWTPSLLNLLLEELHVSDDFDRLVGSTRRLTPSRYPQIIAIALLLRHSWRPQDLARVVTRLGLSPRTAAKAASTKHTPTRPAAAAPVSAASHAPRSSSRRSVRDRKERSR